MIDVKKVTGDGVFVGIFLSMMVAVLCGAGYALIYSIAQQACK